MKLTDLFHKKQAPALSYDHERLEPAMRCSIWTGRFEEVMLVRTDADLAAFKAKYGIEGDVVKFY